MRRRRCISSLDLAAHSALRPRARAFRLSRPPVGAADRGRGYEPTPGSGPVIKAGEFFLGYPDEFGLQPALPKPEILTRNGSYIAYLRLEEHVGPSGNFLKQNGKTPDEQELVAAKLMGRWRSGAPLVLAPEQDDPEIGKDRQRTNDFNYGEDGPVTDMPARWARTSGA